MSQAASASRALADEVFDELQRRGMPAEVVISYPVPLRREGSRALAFFAAYYRPLRDTSNAELFSPLATIVADPDTGAVLEVHELPGGSPAVDQPVGPLLTPEFARPTTEELELALWNAEEELYVRLDQVARIYGGAADDPEARAGCLAAWRRVVPEVLRPTYESLNQDFFRWLESGISSEPAEDALDTAAPAPAPQPAGWSPTHAVPPGGMQAWGVPDPATPAVANLDPGLPLRVVETAGDWARVVASNGWTGWVDGRRLARPG